MAINSYNIKKWYQMLSGTSIQHVNQGLGKVFSKNELMGYYNDLTEKVSDSQIVDEKGIPLFQADSEHIIYFPIMIFQYGLGSYDKYLLEGSQKMLQNVKECAEWAVMNQEDNGAWRNFEFEFPDTPYSSMAQGEGASLLLRAYKEYKDNRYKLAAKKAIQFMLMDIKHGGTTEYLNEGVYQHEFTHLPVVLNGWIFSIFGIYDYLLEFDDAEIRRAYQCSIKTLINSLYLFDNGYWSMYNTKGMITSPFYHNLHIAQLQAMYNLTGEEEFNKYREKWVGYQNSKVKCLRSFVKKTIQKICE